jgi:DNA repair photolyase
MGLNISKGNMYEFVSHTWNVIKGACPHDCSYCYMKRWGKLNPARFDEKELKTDLGSGNFIFVGSSCDMFAEDININWTKKVIEHCKNYDNKYLLQTKNPLGYFKLNLDERFVLGCTIESDVCRDCMGKTPCPSIRALAMEDLKNKKFITIEPILDFNLESFAHMINKINPDWVNIGADSGNNNLPEPSKLKIDMLIKRLNGKITVKKNMKRLDQKG